MPIKDLNKDERDALLAQQADIDAQLRDADLLSVDERQALRAKGHELLDEYVNRLPQVAIGRCPFQGELTLKRMDVFGLDGLWWYVRHPDIPAQCCVHYVTYVGALNLNGNKPEGCSPRAIHEIEPGPDAPEALPGGRPR